MIYSRLRKILETEGLKEMETTGKKFDPFYHEAIKHEPGENETILQTIIKGYLFKGNVLRHAKVIVGKK